MCSTLFGLLGVLAGWKAGVAAEATLAARVTSLEETRDIHLPRLNQNIQDTAIASHDVNELKIIARDLITAMATTNGKLNYLSGLLEAESRKRRTGG